MSARHKARKRALDFLFEADIRKKNPDELVNERGDIDLSERDYVNKLVSGVNVNRGRIDELIIAYAQGWDLDRMPVVDRNILRIAIYELLFEKELPSDVAISEALKLSDENSTEESTKYINGVLARILVLKTTLGF